MSNIKETGVAVPEDRDEVDFAMDYSRERRMRVNLETRLYGLIYEVMPFSRAVNELLEALIRNDHDTMSVCVKQLVEWRADIERHLLLNAGDPVGEDKFATCMEDVFGDREEIPHYVDERYKARCKEAVQLVNKQWDLLAEEYVNLNTAEDCTKQSILRFRGEMEEYLLAAARQKSAPN